LGPTLPVMRELLRRGHEVAVLTALTYKKAIEDLGAIHFSPRDWNPDLKIQPLPPPRTRAGSLLLNRGSMGNIFITDAPLLAKDIKNVLKDWRADVILGNEGTPGVELAASQGGHLWATHHLLMQCTLPSRDLPVFGMGNPLLRGPWGQRKMRLTNAIVRIAMGPLVKKWEEIRAAHGLPPKNFSYILEYMASSYLSIIPSTPDFDYPRSDLPDYVHYVGPCLWDGPSGMQSSWDNPFHDGKPLIYGTAGTVFNHPVFHKTLVEAVRGQPYNLFLTMGLNNDPAALGPLPPNVRAERFVPQHLLWPHVSMMVTNGSDGGVTGALVAGKPLVVAAPQGGPQPETARRCVEAGVGEIVGLHEFTPPKVRAAIENVLWSRRYHNAAEGLGSKLRAMNGPVNAATLFERLAATGRPVLRSELAREARVAPSA
jgi:MGT family glycosyltransferase